MSQTCSRWMALSDRQALGDVLSARQQYFLVAHAAECVACGAESAVYGDLALLVDGSPHAPGPSALHEDERASAARAHPARRRAFGWALAAMAASLALAMVLQQSARPRREPGAVAAVPAIRVALASGGEIEVDGQPAQAGANVALGSLLYARSGAACLLVDQGIRACLAPGGLLRVAELSHTSRRLELRAGKLAASLEPQRAGSSFGVVTREGSAIAVGTAFSVEVPRDGGPVITRVVHGTVLVRSASGTERRVGARHASTMRGAPQPLSARDEKDERPLLELADRAPRARAGGLRIESRPAGAAVFIDGRPVGVTPLGLLVEPGEHALLVNGAQGRSWREQVQVPAGPALVMRFTDPAPLVGPATALDAQDEGLLQHREAASDGRSVPTRPSAGTERQRTASDDAHGASAPAHTARGPRTLRSDESGAAAPGAHESRTRRGEASGTATPGADEPRTQSGAARGTAAPAAREPPAHEESTAGEGSPAELLSTARELRARGDLQGALQSYRTLFARHGGSAEALAARVAYGEMLLASDRDPSGALAAFEHYLARGGPLLREASFGRARALRGMGRPADERAALEDFLRNFPDGPLADAVRARQRALREP